MHSIAIFTVTNKMLKHAEALGAFMGHHTRAGLFPSSPQCRDHLRLLPDRRASAGGKAESLGQWLEISKALKPPKQLRNPWPFCLGVNILLVNLRVYNTLSLCLHWWHSPHWISKNPTSNLVTGALVDSSRGMRRRLHRCNVLLDLAWLIWSMASTMFTCCKHIWHDDPHWPIQVHGRLWD